MKTWQTKSTMITVAVLSWTLALFSLLQSLQRVF